MKQRTLANTVETVGVGLHSGKRVLLKMKPALANTGIIFKRVDLEPNVEIKLDANLVQDTMLCTALVDNDGNTISTIEHLNAALFAMGIDNAIIEVDADEIPIMDGSASPFIYLIKSAGIRELSNKKKFLKIKKTIEVKDGDKWIKLSPFNGFKIDITTDFDHPELGVQNVTLDFSTKNFIEKISRARTLGFMRDFEYLRSQNKCLGGGLDCAIVLDDYKVINEEGFRFDNEVVKHKALDAIGDLFVCGFNVLGELKAYKPGHGLNNLLVRELLSNIESYEIITLTSDEEKQIKFLNDANLVFA